MKNIFKALFLGCFILILCTGCNGDVTRAFRHDGFSVSGNDFDCEVLTEGDNLEKIKFLTSNNIITESGRIYELSFSQKFSNNSQCKEAETNLKLVAIFDNKVFKADDGKLYYLTSNNGTPYTAVTPTDSSYYLYELLLKPEGTIKVITADSSNGQYYVLKSDGNVYAYTITSGGRNASPTIVGTTVVYDRNFYGGNIIDFNYEGDKPSTFVRSDYKVYRMKATNAEECTKYADVKCIYAMSEAEVFNEYNDYIFAYNGNMLITTYNKIFNVAS